ncbi:hypothetical protein LCGC14_1981880 [marine sediment metagenome]|uniref:Uncharacterized protein n=1 Tax=marine sediment metagenome TaxID=412755 RepID=A0A0F9FWU4_9ZZZZ
MNEVKDLLRKQGIKIINDVSGSAVTFKIDNMTNKVVDDVASRLVRGEFRSFEDFTKANKNASNVIAGNNLLKMRSNDIFLQEYNNVLEDSLKEIFNLVKNNVKGFENYEFITFKRQLTNPNFCEKLKQIATSYGQPDLIKKIDGLIFQITMMYDEEYFEDVWENEK